MVQLWQCLGCSISPVLGHSLTIPPSSSSSDDDAVSEVNLTCPPCVMLKIEALL